MQKLFASKLTTSVRVDDTSGDVTAPTIGVVDRVNGDSRFHPVINRVSDNTRGKDIFDRAEVKLPFTCSMFRDVHKAQLIRRSRREVTVHQVVRDRESWFLGIFLAGFHNGGHDAGLVT